MPVEQASDAPQTSTDASWLGAAPATQAWELDWIAARVERGLFGTTQVPAMVGRYELVSRLGAGGMGEVFIARDPVLERDVAIKLVSSVGDGEHGVDRRLLREAQVLARLSHPNIVTCYDAGVAGDTVFFAMELVDGEPMPRWLAAGRSHDQILAAFLEVARGLAAAHAAGVVHRDVKPANIVIDREGRARLLDFGLATRRDDGMRSIHGTPTYMAPEQHVGAPSDERSDVYGFCVSLYEALCGAPPFVGATLDELERAKRTTVPGSRDAAFAGLPLRLRALLSRGLQPDPAARFAGMAEIVRVLEAVRRRGRMAWVGGAVAALAIVAGLGAWSSARERDACAAAAAEIEEVWTPQIVGDVARTHGATVADAVAERVHAWSELRGRLCRDDDAPSEAIAQAQRRCLDVRALELSAAISVLAETGDRGRGLLLVDDLVPVAECESSVVARRTDIVGDDATITALARARAHEMVGRIDDALAAAGEAIARAQANGADLLQARALTTRARLQLGAHRFAPARTDLRRALLLLTSLDDPLAKAEALRQMASIAISSHDVETARWWSDLAAAELRLAGEPLRPTIGVLIGRAWIELAARQPAAALARAEQAYELELARGDIDGFGVIEILVTRGEAKLAGGDPAGARADLERALATARSTRAHEPVYVAAILQRTGLLALDEGRLDDAEALLRESRERELEMSGALMSTSVATLSGLGDLARLRGDLVTSRDRYREAAQTVWIYTGIETRDVMIAETDLAEAELALGNVDAAHDLLAHTRHVLGEREGDEPLRVRATALAARVARARGEADQAEALREQAAALFDGAPGGAAAIAAMNIADDLAQTGRTELACPWYARGVASAGVTPWRRVIDEARRSRAPSCED